MSTNSVDLLFDALTARVAELTAERDRYMAWYYRDAARVEKLKVLLARLADRLHVVIESDTDDCPTGAAAEDAAAYRQARSELADPERLDWCEEQSADGIHIELCHSGSFSGANLKREATVFLRNGEYRAAIDKARKTD